MAKSRRSSQFKAFILESILTPSSFIDTGLDEVNNGVDEGLEAYGLPTDEIELPEPVEPEAAEAMDVTPEDIEVSELRNEIEIIDYIDPLLLTESVDPNVGVFTVDDSGYVSIDYLFDGGKYDQGELAIFSLEGMTEEPGSQAFIQEAARRALSNSKLGYVVISDATDGALFSTMTTTDFNSGEYRGVQTFKMNGGDRFAFILAPNHSIEQVYSGEAWRPLFSMATANPGQEFQVGEITDIASEGMVLTFEDVSVAGGRSDRDYNDLLLHVRGVTGNAPTVEDVIGEGREIQDGLPWDDIVDYLVEPPVIELPVMGSNVIYTDRFFNPTESFSLIGLVDRVDAVDRVEVWVKGFGEEWRPLGDVEDFSSEGHYRFDYGAALDAGHYEVKAIAFYPGGEAEAVTPVTVLSLDAGQEFSYRVKSALERTIDLSNYTPEALRQTPTWIVSVQAGQNVDALAQAIGAVNLGSTDLVVNTFRWEMPENIEVEDWISLLNSQEFIEYAYPLVTSNPDFYSPTNEPFINNPSHPYHQWHITQSGIPSVWNQETYGNNVKVAVVDLGFETGHIDLNQNHLSQYSKNFDNPGSSISSQSSIILNFDDLPIKNSSLDPDKPYSIYNAPNDQWDSIHQNYYRLFQNTNLKGKITDFNISFDIDHQNPQDLDVYLYALHESLYPDVNRKIKLESNGNGFNFDIATLTNLLNPLNDQSWQWQNHKLWGLAIKDNDLEVITEAGWLENLSTTMTIENRHGNNVAGIIAAAGNNNIQGSGIAPAAKWSALQFGSDGTNDVEIASALNHQDQIFDIYQNSWGYDFYGQPTNANVGNFNPPSFLWEATVEANATEGREGKGSIYVFAGGNSEALGGRTDYNAFANSRHTIAVGAVDPSNQSAIYSNPGSSLLISAYSNSGTPGMNDGIVTTDLNNQATNQFGGTSAAAPFVSGVIALMLEANPNLTWRDVQHILIQTANSEILTTTENSKEWKETIINENTMIRHHYQYGFGLINPSAAVEVARSWGAIPPEISTEARKALGSIDGRISQGGFQTWELEITEDIDIESMELIIKGNHPYRGDLEIILESPDGTISVLSEKHGDGNGDDFDRTLYENQRNYNWTFTSLRHWGESSLGTNKTGIWKVTVRDVGDVSISNGRMSSVQLIAYGTDPNFVEKPEPQWQYTTDSFNDSMAGYDVGGTRYEIYSTAVKETEDSIYFAINTNMPTHGHDSTNAQDGHIAWGDLLFNFSGKNLDTASANRELFGIRFADNGAGVGELGVYANVTAKQLARQNGLLLWNESLNGYINWINQHGGNPTMGDLSVYDPYFNQGGHVPNLIASGIKIGDVEVLTDVSQLGLDFGSFGATGTYTFALKFDRHLLPSGDYVYTLAPECDNDVTAGVGSFGQGQN